MAGMGNTRHLTTGSKRPDPPAKDVLRVYGMKFCPYNHRLRLVLAAKDIKHESININLTHKPEWYFDINPRGKVPSLEKNGEILYESDITSSYVDEVYGGKKLITADPLKKAHELIILGYFGEAISAYYSLLLGKNDEKKPELLKKINESLNRVTGFLSKIDKPYICGDDPGMTDYMVWPHLERLSILTPEILQDAKLKAYVERMETDKAVKACRHTNELHMQFIQSVRDGNTTYDIGNIE